MASGTPPLERTLAPPTHRCSRASAKKVTTLALMPDTGGDLHFIHFTRSVPVFVFFAESRRADVCPSPSDGPSYLESLRELRQLHLS